VADEQPEGAIFIIPVRLEECEVPDRLRRWHWVDLFDEKGYERLVSSLRQRQETISGAGKRLKDSSPGIVENSFNHQYKSTNTQSPLRRAVIRSVANFFSSDLLAVDYGTANTKIYAKGKGIVLYEPTIAAVNKVTNEIQVVGKEAKDLTKRTPGNLIIIRPVKEGRISNPAVAGKLLSYFISKSASGRKWVRPRAVVVPFSSGLYPMDTQNLIDLVFNANVAEVHIVEALICAAIGEGLPITLPRASMIVNMGAGVTEVGVISLSGIVYSHSVRAAGNEMDEAVTQYIKRRHNLLIGERTAEAAKIFLGSAFPLDEPLSMDVSGRSLIEGITKTITITDGEIREALSHTVNTIIDAVRIALERAPPELSADIIERGIRLTGGGALLKNLDKRLSSEMGLPVTIADDPLSSVVLGAGKMLSDSAILNRFKWHNG
jgi:rod shape-determining protein MreB